MNHQDHVYLLQSGVPTPGDVWLELGSGEGAFTLALADLIGPTGTIYSVDLDQRALNTQEREMYARFPGTTVHYLRADFSQPLNVPTVDGLLMANSLHFHRDKNAILQLVRGYLRPDGRLIMVEYNVDRGNTWVPHPISYPSWEKLARDNGFGKTRLIATKPSRFLNEIYAALSE